MSLSIVKLRQETQGQRPPQLQPDQLLTNLNCQLINFSYKLISLDHLLDHLDRLTDYAVLSLIHLGCQLLGHHLISRLLPIHCSDLLILSMRHLLAK